jgi:protoporphyrinogen oxidase
MCDHVAVLGAGLSGLAAAQRSRQRGCATDLYEKNPYVGGHASSHEIGGFVFDEGPHVSFTKRPEIRELFADAVDGKFLEHQAIITNYWQGHLVRHPAQTNLYGLPVDVVESCIVDFVKARYEQSGPVETYADWCYQGLGRAFSEQFTFRYTRKYWTTDASNMSTDWVGARMYPPKLEEVVRGALAPHDASHHYLTGFRYPLHGGFGAYVSSLADGQEVHLDHELTCVDLSRKTLEFANGKTAQFDKLISSIPLPELIRRIKDVPSAVAEAAEQLVCTSLVVVNVGVERNKGFPDAHWMYFYDEDAIFARGNFPHRLSPNNAPAGCASIQLEVYHSKYRPLSCEDVLNRTMEDLISNGLLEKQDRILVAQEQRIPYANVLFDLQRARNLALIRDYLNERDVICCGRYGEWGYLWTDDSIVSGWAAADRVVDGALVEDESKQPV